MKEDYQKDLKKVTLLFLSNPVPFYEQDHKKQKQAGTSDQLLLRLQSRLRKFPSLVIHDTINYSSFICPFESGKCEEEGKQSQKFENIKNRKRFLDETKSIFIVFGGLLF